VVSDDKMIVMFHNCGVYKKTTQANSIIFTLSLMVRPRTNNTKQKGTPAYPQAFLLSTSRVILKNFGRFLETGNL
jgi:hypothetical protein